MPSLELPTTAKRNVQAIAKMEQELHGRRSRIERVGDGIACFFGTLWFIVAHALFFGGWIICNSIALVPVERFDPYPFPLLALVLAIEFIFLTTFVLMNQRLQSRRQEQWSHLNIQFCMLAEHEVTKNMQMLQLICEHFRLQQPGEDQEVKELTQTTPVTTLVEEIKKSREEDKS